MGKSGETSGLPDGSLRRRPIDCRCLLSTVPNTETERGNTVGMWVAALGSYASGPAALRTPEHRPTSIATAPGNVRYAYCMHTCY